MVVGAEGGGAGGKAVVTIDGVHYGLDSSKRALVRLQSAGAHRGDIGKGSTAAGETAAAAGGVDGGGAKTLVGKTSTAPFVPKRVSIQGVTYVKHTR
jgi:hypothetical protein